MVYTVDYEVVVRMYVKAATVEEAEVLARDRVTRRCEEFNNTHSEEMLPRCLVCVDNVVGE